MGKQRQFNADSCKNAAFQPPGIDCILSAGIGTQRNLPDTDVLLLFLECPTTQISPYKGKCFHSPDEENIVYTYFKKYKNEQPVAKTATTLYFKAITQNLLLDSSCLKL